MRPLRDQQELTRLFERCRRKDSRAWAELVDQFQALVYSVSRGHGLNRDDAEDVFIATFQNLLGSIDRIESTAALPRWLAVTASRESLRICRIANRSPDTEATGTTLDEIVASEEGQAEEAAFAADRSLRVRAALARIDDRCRKLLQMLYFQDESSYQEISAALGMPVGAIGPTRARCMEKLRSNLNSEDFFDS